jgi:hypothetical protein
MVLFLIMLENSSPGSERGKMAPNSLRSAHVSQKNEGLVKEGEEFNEEDTKPSFL